ncbi:MAG: oligosaccharide repeat unit polymerase [Flavobacteriaceae bacterium]|nr:oligosaccharide repeat unit polymerase [Flavobacteriaceae bacterium]
MRKLSALIIGLQLILLGIFFLPFNSWEGISFLGEYYRDSCFLFFISAFFILLFKKKINIPYNNLIFQLLLFFISWAFIATLLNFYNVSEYYFKQTSGTFRFINQFGSLIIAAFILPITFYNGFKSFNIERLLILIRKSILISLLIVFLYSIIEVLIVKFDVFWLKKSVLNLFDYFPFTDARTDMRLNRISAVSFEPPALGTYLISIAGWMISYIITEEKRSKYIPSLIILFLGFVSGSRAAFFAILIQFFVAALILLRKTQSKKNIYKIILIAFFSSAVVLGTYNKQIFDYVKQEISSFKLNDSTHALSNKSRFGIQQAMFKVFLENPFSGTGYGQQAFESWKKYPNWAKNNNWEFRLKYLNQNDKRFPPGYNLYLRILSETGIIGMLIFGLLLLQIFLWCFNNLKNKRKIYSFIILVSMIGFSLNWLKMDSFRIYFFWICLALIFVIENSKKLSNE